MGRKDEAIQVWEQGYDHALHQSADLKQLLELEELLNTTKQSNPIASQNHVLEFSGSSNGANGSVLSLSFKSSETGDNHPLSSYEFVPSVDSPEQLEISVDSNDTSGSSNDLNNGIMGPEAHSQSNGIHKNQANGSCDIKNKLKDQSVFNGESKDISQSHQKPSTDSGESNDTSESDKFVWSDALKKSKKYCVARMSKTKSINVDFRLSRGIAQVHT